MTDVKKQSTSYISLVVIIIVLFLTTNCEKQLSGDRGLLTGKISIGPICPVERIPPVPECMPTAETYRAYPVVIVTSDGIRKVTGLKPAPDGTFSTELEAGHYMLILESAPNGIGGSNMPLNVVIRSNGITTINIDIDTGIR